MADERQLQFARQRVDAIEDREVVEAPASIADGRGDLLDDTVGLVAAVTERRPADSDAGWVVCLEPLRLAMDVVGDQLVRRRENRFRASEVLFKANDLRTWVISLEPQDVLDASAAPTVDRLIGVAGHAEVRLDLGECPHDRIL